MKLSRRTRAALIICCTIAAGLLSRKVPAVPAATGDACYALMMFFIVRFLCIHTSTGSVAVASTVTCFLIECSQLYQAPWIQAVRTTLPGRLILGQGFLWTDLAAYLAGIIVAVLVEKLCHTAP